MTGISRFLLVVGTFALAVSYCNAADATVIPVCDFADSVRTAQGGYFFCIGARPQQVCDYLLIDTNTSRETWRIDIAAGAPEEGVGGVLPLFDNRSGMKAKNASIAEAKFLWIRLKGQLGKRRLEIDLADASRLHAQAPAIILATIDAGRLTTESYSEFILALPDNVMASGEVGAIRLMLRGTGPCRITVDSVAFLTSMDCHVTPAPAKPAHPIRQAMWVWNTGKILQDKKEIKQLLAFAAKHGITDLYCQIHHGMVNGRLELQLVDEQKAFNAAAHQAGITIHALDGAPHYVVAVNHNISVEIVNAIDRFNKSAEVTQRFKAVHMDNEPHVLKQWRDPKRLTELIKDYVDLNRELSHHVRMAGMKYGVDIPFWWDTRDAEGEYKFQYVTDQGKTPILEALFPYLDNAGIMSYRQRVTGPNSVVECCTTELALAKRFDVDLFCSIELGTGNDVEKGISMGEFGYRYLAHQLDTLRIALKREEGCAGIAIHYYRPFRAMEIGG